MQKGSAGPVDLGPTVSATKPPPPISGGTLALSRDGALAIAADPDRDAVHIVDLKTRSVFDIVLQENDEPGRVVVDDGQRAHVVLRRGGAIATIDLTTKQVERRAVCAAPRGIAHDPKGDVVHVACAGGEFVTLPAAGGAATRSVMIERDLRDVVVRGDQLFVSTFRSAQLLELAADGTVKNRRVAADTVAVSPLRKFAPHVAWRTVADPGGGIVMLHQRSRLGPVATSPGGYGSDSPCGSIVQGTTSRFDTGSNAPTAAPALVHAVLPVDIAFTNDGTRFAVVSAGNAKLLGSRSIAIGERSTLAGSPDGCVGFADIGIGSQFIAVAWTPDNRLVYQSREPALLVVAGSEPITLSAVSRADTGHAIFHTNTGAGIACASCHPEGGDDAHVWTFQGVGPRRTQTFRGGVLGTEPLHWDGDMKDVGMLMSNVFSARMSGFPLDDGQLSALTKWVDAIPTIPGSPSRDPAAVARGAALFSDPTVGCSGCHSGKRFTNNTTVDVGTGKPLQVPSLGGIAFRAPYLHDGCAPTLLDRFGACGGGDMHGKTSDLTDAQKNDLVAYLETL